MIPRHYFRAKDYLHEMLNTSAPSLFMREWLNAPANIGAIWPSSRQLARRMAEQVPATGQGVVVELGAGTGAVTQALLERNIAPRRLVVVERSPAFVRHLRGRFPQINVVSGDARYLAAELPPNTTVDAVVSSLPLRSLSTADVAAIVSQWHQLLSPEGVVVQFTYDLRKRLSGDMPDFSLLSSSFAWNNLPPARVMTLKRDRIDTPLHQ